MNSRISSDFTISNIRALECCLVWTSLHFLRQLSWENLLLLYKMPFKGQRQNITTKWVWWSLQSRHLRWLHSYSRAASTQTPTKTLLECQVLTHMRYSLTISEPHLLHIASWYKFILVIWYSPSVALSESPMVNQITDPFLTKIYLAYSSPIPNDNWMISKI